MSVSTVLHLAHAKALADVRKLKVTEAIVVVHALKEESEVLTLAFEELLQMYARELLRLGTTAEEVKRLLDL